MLHVKGNATDGEVSGLGKLEASTVRFVTLEEATAGVGRVGLREIDNPVVLGGLANDLG
jgi:hypothetical protein